MYCLSIFFLSVYMEYSRVGKRKERTKLSVAKFAGIDGVNYLVGDRGDYPPPPTLSIPLKWYTQRIFFFAQYLYSPLFTFSVFLKFQETKMNAWSWGEISCSLCVRYDSISFRGCLFFQCEEARILRLVSRMKATTSSKSFISSVRSGLILTLRLQWKRRIENESDISKM